MSQFSLPGNPEIVINLRRSARARRLSLRISSLDGRVTLTLPNSVSQDEALRFAASKQDWLRKHLSKQSQPVTLTFGATFPFEGSLLTLRPGDGRSIRIHNSDLIIPAPPDQIAPKLKAWLKARARDRLVDMSDYFSEKLGRPYNRITLRDTRSRWGSCTSDGRLMYSWRLIMAWPEVLDYVAAHEVAHLAQMNHSPAFWSEVERIYGDWQSPRKWLRDHGHELHRYRFDS